MIEKRFTEIISTQKIVDNVTGREYDGLVEDDLLHLMNELADEKEQLILAVKDSCGFIKLFNGGDVE